MITDNWATIFNKAQEHQKPRKAQILVAYIFVLYINCSPISSKYNIPLLLIINGILRCNVLLSYYIQCKIADSFLTTVFLKIVTVTECQDKLDGLARSRCTALRLGPHDAFFPQTASAAIPHAAGLTMKTHSYKYNRPHDSVWPKIPAACRNMLRRFRIGRPHDPIFPRAFKKLINMFDYEKMIIEIESRPCLWDMESAEYSDKHLKALSWNSVAEVMYVSTSKVVTMNKTSKMLLRIYELLMRNIVLIEYLNLNIKRKI
ncbi:hypothetical protein AGLY_007053 [Aphis glycines]|uniref:MADF domain-containing protein n=1 Tax=Aphis glycines TaxID=307491 RepID=A0A6G0TRU0_APHGL|nr:hypothetical protein AGLY_007053 [Aphis glycines]